MALDRIDSAAAQPAGPITPRAAARIAGVFFFAIVVIRSAWMCDDAYITFRVVDNFLDGYGLRWNIIERVQVYTHPLWMMLVTAAHFATGELYYTVLAMSVAFSVMAVARVTSASRDAAGVAFCAAAFVCSNAFVDYSTSGLENSLSHFLLACFATRFLGDRRDASDLRYLSVIAGLAAVNRLDSAVLYAPMLAVAFWQRRGLRAAGALLLGTLPLIAWELFSVVYYGFLLPNTAYAKLPDNLPKDVVVTQGFIYLLDSIYRDPVTLFVCAAGIAAALVKGDARSRACAAAMGAYLLYVVWVGGDFMSGRFLSMPFVLGVVLVQGRLIGPPPVLGASAIAAVVALCWLSPMLTLGRVGEGNLGSRNLYEEGAMVSDERAKYAPGTGLLNVGRARTPMRDESWVKHGKMLRPTSSGRSARSGDVTGPPTTPAARDVVVLKMGAGLGPYHAGPLVHFIDRNGLCDPLLARMDPAAWGMSGHNFREVPAGYAAYLEDGTTPITHPKIAEYYAMLETVVRGPIFTWERFDAIWKFHSGQMDSLLPRVWVPVDLAKLTPEQRLKWRELQLTRAEKDLISETGDSDAGIPPEDSTK